MESNIDNAWRNFSCDVNLLFQNSLSFLFQPILSLVLDCLYWWVAVQKLGQWATYRVENRVYVLRINRSRDHQVVGLRVTGSPDHWVIGSRGQEVTGSGQRFWSGRSRVKTLDYGSSSGCLGGTVVERWTRDRKVAGSTPGRGAIKSTRSTQPYIPPG